MSKNLLGVVQIGAGLIFVSLVISSGTANGNDGAQDGTGDKQNAKNQLAGIDDVKSNGQHETANGDNRQGGQDTGGGWSLRFACIVAIAAVAQAVFVSFQWRVMHRQHTAMLSQLEIAKCQLNQAAKSSEQTDEIIKQMRLEQRAWLGMSANITPIENGKRIECELHIKNTGKTPGYITKIITTMTTAQLATPLESLLEFHGDTKDGEIRENVIPPDFVLKMKLRGIPEFPQAVMEQLAKGEKCLFLIATIWYLDATKQSRETQSCYWYDHTLKTMHAAEKGHRML